MCTSKNRKRPYIPSNSDATCFTVDTPPEETQAWKLYSDSNSRVKLLSPEKLVEFHNKTAFSRQKEGEGERARTCFKEITLKKKQLINNSSRATHLAYSNFQKPQDLKLIWKHPFKTWNEYCSNLLQPLPCTLSLVNLWTAKLNTTLLC